MSSNPNQGDGAAGSDYLDKAFNTVASKFGGAEGKKIAANKGLSEKIVCFSPLPYPFPPSFHLFLPYLTYRSTLYRLTQVTPLGGQPRKKKRERAERRGKKKANANAYPLDRRNAQSVRKSDGEEG